MASGFENIPGQQGLFGNGSDDASENETFSDLHLLFTPQKECCEPCGRDKLQQRATAYCCDCMELLCTECTRHHKRSKCSLEHTICELKDGVKDFSKIEYLNKISKCSKHESENVKYLCSDHDSLCCNECAIVEHRQCQKLISIATDQSSDVNLDDAKCNLVKLSDATEALQNHENLHMTVVRASTNEAVASLAALKREIDRAFETVESEIKETLWLSQQDILHSMSCQLSALERLKGTLNVSKEKIAAVTQFGKHNHHYLVRRQLSSDIKSEVELLKQCYWDISMKKLTLIGTKNFYQEFTSSLRQSLQVSTCDILPQLPSFPDIEGIECKTMQIQAPTCYTVPQMQRVPGIKGIACNTMQHRTSEYSTPHLSANTGKQGLPRGPYHYGK